VKHVDAKELVDSLPGVSPAESLFLRGVSWHETNYGQGWKPGFGAGSNNMGAITTPNPNQYSFQHQDVRNDKGKVTKYVTWFKGYPNARLGFNDLKDTVLKPNVRAAIKKHGVAGGIEAMHANKYFLGVHRNDTPEGAAANIRDYLGAVEKGLRTIATNTGEDLSKLAPKGHGFLWALAAAAAAVAGVVIWRFSSK